ncbi:MAG TPA: efflux RND transporter periplasmic adaptor subunit [Candidatus Binatia bacterium]|nr:efflux RND transporter periplasmic adaptor subunit [Candidatus Binatia bacterium]
MIRLAILCGLLLGGLAGCGGPDGGAAATPPAGMLTPAQLTFLKFAPVTQVEAGELADVAGTIEFDPRHTARLNALVPGRVAELLVEVGDPVEAGQPLLALDSPDVKAAQAEYVRAQADLVVARRAAARAASLRAAGAVAEKDYLQATEDARKAEADFERARAQLDRLGVAPGERTSRYVLRAPLAGTVVERRALVGMDAGPDAAEPLVVVSDLAHLRVAARLPERQLALVRAGEAVGVHVDAYPQEFPGAVAAVGDVIDEATRTVPVRCTLPNPDRLLKPAMFARVTLKAPPGMRLTVVPTTALLSDGRGYRVVVRGADGKLAVRPIEVGAEVGGQVQVLGGVALGEEVVVDGALLAAQALAAS